MINLLANLQSIKPFTMIDLQIHDIVDIIIVALFIYFVLLFIKQTRSYFVFTTVIVLLVISYAANYFDLELTRKLFEPILTFFLVIFVVVFQREIRRFFSWLSVRRSAVMNKKISGSLELCAIITDAVMELARIKSGAIIVLPGDYPLEDFTEGGFSLDGKVTVPLLLSIFDHNSPGHDGAVVIADGRIRRFGVHLPLAENFHNTKVGTRHRASVGITERTDAMAIVVSEERGTISIAEHGGLRNIEGRDELEESIKKFLNVIEVEDTETPLHYIIFDNLTQKLISLGIAAVLWFALVFQASVTNRDLIVPLEFKHVPDSLEVDKVTPAMIDVTVSGDNTDVSALTINDIRVIVDLTNAQSGTEPISITDDNVTYPSYLNLIKVTPEKFSVTLSSTTKAVE